MSDSLRRIKSELRNITSNLPDDCSAFPILDGSDIYEWQGHITGPSDTPYEGGTFFVNIHLPENYPYCPPKVTLQTRIYHCNINQNGGISLDILQDQWSPALSIATILVSIMSLLSEPNPDDPLVHEIARIYKEDKEQHDRRAKEWTEKYAT